MTDTELRDAAEVELRQTTNGWLKTNGTPHYPSGTAPLTTHWGKGMSLLGQISSANTAHRDAAVHYLKLTTKGYSATGKNWQLAFAELAKIVNAPQPPPEPPPPNGAVGVNPATMLATGGRILREDVSAQADPLPGLWGFMDAGSPTRHVYMTSGGDPRPKADGTAQGNSAYRQLTVHDGDSQGSSGERCELGRNDRRNGENTGTQTSGTFALYHNNDHKVTFFSSRFGAGFSPGASTWQTIVQMKQAQPYAANGPTDGAPVLELQVYGGQLRLHASWKEIWSCPCPPAGAWWRCALDVQYSMDPKVGYVNVYVDANNDGTAEYVSGKKYLQTIANCTSAGSGLNVGDPIPGHLRLGIYHNASLGQATVDVDNVQVVG